MRVKEFESIATPALRRLTALDSAQALTDLLIPPGNRWEALQEDRQGRHSIRINDQYRICFTRKEDNAHDVEITKDIRVAPNRISAIVAGQRSITGETALRLARYFNTTPAYWVNLQARYDLETARDQWESRILSEVRPRNAA